MAESSGPDATGPRGAMISVAEHLESILGAVRRLDVVELDLPDAAGAVLARDAISRLDLPGFDNSAMDGYAVRAADVARASAASPVTLPVDGDVPAGCADPTPVASGRCVRVMTGAPMPAGADAVVPVENSDGGAREVRITAPAGAHVRRRGTDLRAGDTVLTAGTRLGARQIAVLAASGHGRVPAVRVPHVVVVSTGDELVPPGVEPGPGQLVDSNSLMLVTAAREAGFTAELVRGVVDTEDAVLAALDDAAGHADAIVTTGGVSMGVYDAVKAALSRLGTVEFTKVAMQPGKPQGFGTIGAGATPVFTLPGNPVSAMVSFEVFVAPALRVMAGRRAHETRLVRAVADDSFTSPEGKTQFARGVLRRTTTHHTVAAAGGQGSHMLGSLAAANALMVVPPETTRVVPGQDVLCLPIGPIRYEDDEERSGFAGPELVGGPR
ncbi:molybdotransferase-like divisome protein Glp [Agilicoccus flavus]|uniref:molybdotransferase-like divisome protein Glp n=1 Tax=Agilicoccus flavus TaxID=2775968 RepID=UPI001CF69DDE|nr:gephyrin-like molybdotransferase Glp [Agilicoccus flavus]